MDRFFVDFLRIWQPFWEPGWSQNRYKKMLKNDAKTMTTKMATKSNMDDHGWESVATSKGWKKKEAKETKNDNKKNANR